MNVRATVRALALGALLTLGCNLLAGCASVKPVKTASNPHTYVVDCSGASLTWSHCYRKAGRACPQGYHVVQKPYKHNDGIVSGDFLQLLGNSSAHRRMLIACRNGDDHSAAPEPIPHTSAPPDEGEDDGDSLLQR